MASVHYLKCEGFKVPFSIRSKFGVNEVDTKRKQWAAVKIQKVWRGYLTRKWIEMLNQKATIIQKWYRGWIVRWHLPEIIQKCLEERRIKYYNDKATKIQAWWKGVFTRKYGINAKDLIAKRKQWEKNNMDMMEELRRLFNKNNKKKGLGDEITEEELEEMEEEARKHVLYELYKIHHLLRTYEIEGIFSLHGKHKYSYIEKLLKSVKFKDYMITLHNEYYKRLKMGKTDSDDAFSTNGQKSKMLQKMEALYKMRDTSHDPKEVKVKPPDFEQEKPFDLHTTLSRDKPFYPSVFLEEPYREKYDILKRTFDRTKNISKTSFNLHVKQHYEPKEIRPPYYLDFWEEKKCKRHNCSKIFHDVNT